LNFSKKIETIVKGHFSEDPTGHDWHHIDRVRNMALLIQENEGGDKEIVEIAALLHDISDHKLNGGVLNDNGRASKEILESIDYPSERMEKVIAIVDAVSFKGAGLEDTDGSIELSIVRDADRLDAIGAIGIARAFAYGGHKNRPIYEPSISSEFHEKFESYANSKSHTINHFHEKLLLLKNRLRTPTARKIGEHRHKFMEEFLKEFLNDWNLNC
jgi:uncharacterized protein